MKKKGKNNSYSTDKVIVLAFLIGVFLLIGIFLLCTSYERSEGSRMIDETLDFMKMQCLRYDNLTASRQAEDQIQLLDKTKELGRCLEEQGKSEIKSFLESYAENQRLSGIILLNQEGKPLQSVSLDEQTYEDWESILQDKNIVNIMEYPQKSYISYRQKDDSIYDYAVITQTSEKGLILCYEKRRQSETDEMSIGLDNLLSGYRLEMDGLILITDGTKILSSNEEELQEQEILNYPLIAGHNEEISSEKMSTIKEDGTTYLARFSKFRNYYLYVFFPAKSVFRQRSVIIVDVLIFYILFLLIIAVIKQRETQNANQLKMKFLRQMSHDIRTPINGIRGMIQIGNSFPEDLEKQRECRDKIWEASGYLMDLVNDVLDMGKLESGEIKLEEKPFNLQKLVQNELEIMIGQAKGRNITLQLGQMEGEHWNLIGSPIHIQRVLTNILTNAIKYNKENGSVTFSCRELQKKEESGIATYEFVCSDTGIGMSREFQKRMFEQFTQENAAGEVSHHGTGLGLTIVKSLVEEMGGEIRCESEHGKGTTFYITLPFVIDKETKILEEVAEEKNDIQLEGVSILLVEDNELNMEIAEFILEEEGAVIQKAWNGHEAVQIFESSKPGDFQIILMDIMMPTMDGETAAQAIRALDREDAKTIPIIAMTANAFVDDIESALQAGMNAHIAKPIDVEELKKVIRKHL
jgi:signal transduction histidine kinase/ActR/RegA family two-component response regulator